jgi:polyisoprenoid-binding protein YceI
MATNQAALEQQQIEIPAPGTYTLDLSHTTVGFVARHLMVAKVRGSFEELSGTVVIGETPEASSVDVAIAAKSITTGDPKRDEHLRSPDFLDVETYPELRFRSTAVRQTGDIDLDIDGELTIRDVTRPVTLHASYEGRVTAPWGGERAGFSAWTEIDREDWDITWNMALETGGVLVGKKVKLAVELQLIAN